MATRRKKKRKRATAEQVRKNAKKGGGNGNLLNLPSGVREWRPEKKGTYSINVLPYEVSVDTHPDEIEAGTLWYKREYWIHRNIGPNKLRVVCRKAINKKCPACEERFRLEKEYEDLPPRKQKAKEALYKEQIRALKGQLFCMFNIEDPDDPEQIAVFNFAAGKFWKTDRGNGGLQKELDEGSEEDILFFHCEDGKTLECRFSEDSFSGSTFLKVTKIDFEPREDMDEDEVLEATVDLDKALNVLPYDRFKALLLEGDEEEDDDGDGEEEEKPKRKKKKKKKVAVKKKKKKAKKKKTLECPEGETFGEDFETMDECADCDLWEECEKASGL